MTYLANLARAGRTNSLSSSLSIDVSLYRSTTATAPPPVSLMGLLPLGDAEVYLC